MTLMIALGNTRLPVLLRCSPGHIACLTHPSCFLLHFLLFLPAGRTDFDGMLKAFLAILLAAMGIAQAQIGFPDIGKAKTAVQVRHVLDFAWVRAS